MANLTIRNLNENLKRQLRIRAAEQGHSMEEEARIILQTALAKERKPSQKLAAVIHNRLKSLGGLDLPEVKREAMREPPKFEE